MPLASCACSRLIRKTLYMRAQFNNRQRPCSRDLSLSMLNRMHIAGMQCYRNGKAGATVLTFEAETLFTGVKRE